MIERRKDQTGYFPDLFTQMGIQAIEQAFTSVGTDPSTLEQIMGIAHRRSGEIRVIGQSMLRRLYLPDRVMEVRRLARRSRDPVGALRAVTITTAQEFAPQIRSIFEHERDQYQPEVWQKIEEVLKRVFPQDSKRTTID